MHNTTKTEDNVIAQCKAFGGSAADCVDIVERLDLEIEKLRDTISNLETDVARLEAEISNLT